MQKVSPAFLHLVNNLFFGYNYFMKSRKINNAYIIVLDKGEEIIKTLTKFCDEKNIKFGSISGIGGADNVVIKYYDLKKQKYISKCFSGKNYEIILLNGNITKVSGKSFPHLHVVIGDSDYKSYSGHLESAVISLTCEIFISFFNQQINRKFNKKFKLNFIDL